VTSFSSCFRFEFYWYNTSKSELKWKKSRTFIWWED